MKEFQRFTRGSVTSEKKCSSAFFMDSSGQRVKREIYWAQFSLLSQSSFLAPVILLYEESQIDIQKTPSLPHRRPKLRKPFPVKVFKHSRAASRADTGVQVHF